MPGNLEHGRQLARQTQQYARTILDSLAAHVAIIDENGVILETNRAWKEFASANRIGMRPDTLNVNYLDICDAAKGYSDEKAGQVASGIRSVISGKSEDFTLNYPCHSPDQKRWFFMRVTRGVGPGPLRVVVSHENITALKMSEELLRNKEKELRRKTAHLQEANAALRAVLRQRDEDRKNIEEVFHQNLIRAVQPYLERLKLLEQDEEKAGLIELIESGLKEIYSPFLRRLSLVEKFLTPQEIQVAHLVRDGKSTKDIASLLNLSTTTINFHRRNLRAKLGLVNSAVNLRAYLSSLE